jgi:hypothetical protein
MAIVACLVLCAVGLLPLAAQGAGAPFTPDLRGGTTPTQPPRYQYDQAPRNGSTPSIVVVRARLVVAHAPAHSVPGKLPHGFATGFGVAARAEADVAYHYTFREAVTSIERHGLRPGSYATPNGSLSPLQA